VKVCLHCRHAAREKARERRRHVLVRVGAAALGLLVVTSLAAGARALNNGRLTTTGIRTRQAPRRIGASSVRPAPAVVAVRPAPIVAEGRTELGDGLFATRAGDTVTVRFDTPDARTRRPEKFERVVRATLPRVYGMVADTILASVAEGALTGPGDLLTELPSQGVRLASASGWMVALWPETRPGAAGPLVVAYRATLTRRPARSSRRRADPTLRSRAALWRDHFSTTITDSLA
jgi:hypothetical protein